MRRLLFAALFALIALPAHAQQARVVAACGNLAPFGPQAAGGSALPTIDVNGRLCLAAGGGGGSITVPPSGTTPITGTCPNGEFLYNNAGVVGCSASSASIAFPQAVTSGVSGGIPYFSNANTMSASPLLAANALMVGGGVGAGPATVTTGAGVLAELANAPNTAGGAALVSTVPTVGDFVKWAAGGIVDGGSGTSGGTITAGTTATSGFTAGQVLVSDGSAAQTNQGVFTQWSDNPGSYPIYMGGKSAIPSSFLSINATGVLGVRGIGLNVFPNGAGGINVDGFRAGAYIGFSVDGEAMGLSPSVAFVPDAVSTIAVRDVESLITATAFRVDNTYTDASNGEWGALDWLTTANVLTIGAQANGTGTVRPVKIVGSNFQVPSLTSIGTKPTVTGAGGTCAAGTTVGGALAGTFQTSAVCAAGNTIALTGMPASATGYACDATDRTLPAALIQQTASTTTGATFTVAGTSTAASNVISWKCMGY